MPERDGGLGGIHLKFRAYSICIISVRRGLGIADMGQIEVLGERLEDVATIFERPSTFIG